MYSLKGNGYIIPSDNVVAFDVDDTLVMWDFAADAEGIISIGHPEYTKRVLPHYRHVEELKKFKTRGQTVIVWSAGGYDWAKLVVEALGLSRYVDLIMCKPRWYFDDMEADDWMTRVYKII